MNQSAEIDLIQGCLRAARVWCWRDTVVLWSPKERADVQVWCDAVQEGHKDHPRPLCLPRPLTYVVLRNGPSRFGRFAFPFDRYGEAAETEVLLGEAEIRPDSQTMDDVVRLRLRCEDGSEIDAEYGLMRGSESLFLIQWEWRVRWVEPRSHRRRSLDFFNFSRA